MPKFYAVKSGRTCGIFTSWGECEKQVKGFSGAQYKSFSSADDASKYLEEPDKKVMPQAVSSTQTVSQDTVVEAPEAVKHPSDAIEVYVDGSYNAETGCYGYGCLIDYGNKRKVLYGNGICKANGRNVEGEVAGARAALSDISKGNNSKNVVMYYDYEGIGSWADGKWKANKDYTAGYADFVKKCRSEGMQIEFSHVKGHTGNQGNEYVDKIAKVACGVDLTRSEQEMLSQLSDVPGMPPVFDNLTTEQQSCDQIEV